MQAWNVWNHLYRLLEKVARLTASGDIEAVKRYLREASYSSSIVGRVVAIFNPCFARAESGLDQMSSCRCVCYQKFHYNLAGGFKHFFSPLPGEMIQCD